VSCESEGSIRELRDRETRVCSATRARAEVRVGRVDSRGVYACTGVSSASVKLRRDCREASGRKPTRNTTSASAFVQLQVRRYTRRDACSRLASTPEYSLCCLLLCRVALSPLAGFASPQPRNSPSPRACNACCYLIPRSDPTIATLSSTPGPDLHRFGTERLEEHDSRRPLSSELPLRLDRSLAPCLRRTKSPTCLSCTQSSCLCVRVRPGFVCLPA
jgi:hypothetical protein